VFTTAGIIFVLLIVCAVFLFLARRILRIALKLALVMALFSLFLLAPALAGGAVGLTPAQGPTFRRPQQTRAPLRPIAGVSARTEFQSALQNQHVIDRPPLRIFAR
jgi:multisubunit Na+/H+ antiporter MnhC subunit